MKYSFVLILLLFISSCYGTKKTAESQPESTNEVAIVTETHEIDKTTEIINGDGETLETIEVVDYGDNIITEVENQEEADNLIRTEKIHDSIYFIEIAKHNEWDKLLKEYVSESGKVNYESFKRDKSKLREYINYLKDHQPTKAWMKNQKLAYWINAYNALTIDLILRNYPTKSIKDIKDPWDQRLWQFGDKWLNLNDIEHQILRKMNEPRIHFAIVCASVSCPKLQNEAFTASNLEEQLTNATKEFLADKSKNDISQNNLKLSKIFKWFKKDFEQEGSLIDFLNQYSTVIISDSAKKSYKDYNWDLNE